MFGGLYYLYICNAKEFKKQQKPKDIVTIALDSKISASDPRIIGSDANSQYIENIRFLPLISFDEQGQILSIFLLMKLKRYPIKLGNITP